MGKACSSLRQIGNSVVTADGVYPRIGAGFPLILRGPRSEVNPLSGGTLSQTADAGSVGHVGDAASVAVQTHDPPAQRMHALSQLAVRPHGTLESILLSG